MQVRKSKPSANQEQKQVSPINRTHANKLSASIRTAARQGSQPPLHHHAAGPSHGKKGTQEERSGREGGEGRGGKGKGRGREWGGEGKGKGKKRERKKEKVSPFTDKVTLSMENHKGYNKAAELFSEVTEFKVNTQKSQSYFYIVAMNSQK
jgi:hypothetical protein